MLYLDRDDLVELYVPGTSMQHVADALGVSAEVVSRELRRHGIPRHNSRAAVLDEAAVVAAYVEHGQSVQAIARDLDVTRAAVDRVIVAAGVKRTAGDQQRITAARRTPAERRAMTRAAHDAKRGVPNSREALERAAVTRQRKATPGSDGERDMLTWLRARGHDPVVQQAVGIYNVDLAVAPVAVEIMGGQWHAHGLHAAREPQRCEHILDAGWLMIYVWDQPRRPMRVDAADYVVAVVEQTRRNPAAVGEYRVVTGDGKLASSGRGRPDHGAFVPSQERG